MTVIRKKVATTRPTTKGFQRPFYVLDASKEPLGRLASKAAMLLTGKNRADYSKDVNMGAIVVVINAKNLVLTGKKAIKKNYFRHTGTPGGLKIRSIQEQMELDCTVPIIKAIRGMLPKNRQRDVRSHQLLHVFAEEHNLPNQMIQGN